MMYHHSSSSRTFVALIFCISHNLPLIHSLAASNCVALPCTYTKECRDRFNTCGRGQSFCNSESLWLPACGGGGSLERPSGNDNDNVDANDQNQSTTPPPTPLPTLRNTPTPTKRATNASTGGLPTFPPQPSSTPATPPTPASIVSSAEQNGNDPKNEIDASTSNEDSGSYNPSNVAWFDKAGWDGRREKDEDAGTNEALVMRRSSCVLFGLAAIIHLFMLLD